MRVVARVFLHLVCSIPGCGNLMFALIPSFPDRIAQAVAALLAGGPSVNMTAKGKGSLFLAAALFGVSVAVQGLRAQTLGRPTPEALEDSVEGNVAPVLLAEAASPSQTGPTSARTGSFRVGNRTPHPVRVVILMRSGGRLLNPETAHWDFAPGEGGSEGLVLSLGEEPLQIGPGDIVVAFVLDGTRRYWGPNVVGESLAPFWNEESGSWSMILQP
ncbi:hypothetical protein NW826_04325 [Synechococcus sp. OH20]